MQADFISTGSLNHVPALGIGTNPTTIAEGVVGIQMSLAHLKAGSVVELAQIGFHSPIDSTKNPSPVWFRRGRDFSRHFLEVTSVGAPSRPHDKLAQVVREQELALQAAFMEDWTDPRMGSPKMTFAVVVVLHGVLVTQSAYFDRWALHPAGRRGSFANAQIVNEILAKPPYRAGFGFSDPDAKDAAGGEPFATIQFPALRGETQEHVVAFATAKAEALLQALSYTRGASGSIFAVVTAPRNGDAPNLHLPQYWYRGNALGGHLSGEDSESLLWLANRLESDAQLAYFMQLYREARAEKSIDYQYLRHWTFLEVIAQSKNFPGNPILLDEIGNPILRRGKPLNLMHAPGGVVYFMLYSARKELGVSLATQTSNATANQYSLWDYVQAWNVFRHAAAHFGGFRPGDPVQISQFDNYSDALRIWNDQANASWNFVLDLLVAESEAAIIRELRIRRIGQI